MAPVFNPAPPDGPTVAIAVTVLTAPPPPVFVEVAVSEETGVELGEESSTHAELLEGPTVRRSLDPPCLFLPASNEARMNCVPAAMLVFHKRDVEEPTEENWNGCPEGIIPRIVTGSVAVLSQ
jgi:hypothetical protein